MGAIVHVAGLSKQYGKFTAVDDVSFSIEAGEVFGFLGPNGAGKTTTINVLCTLLRPTAGTVRIADHDVGREPRQVRQAIGLIFQDPSLDVQLTAEQNLRFHADVYNVPASEYEQRAAELLDLVGLAARRHDRVRTFSGGMRRRLEIARALLHQPKVFFLDEPTVGLDPQTRAQLWEHLLALRHRRNLTLFLTTHYLDEAEHCDRIAIMDHGRLVALDTPAALKALVGGDVVSLRSSDLAEAQAQLVAKFSLPVSEQNGELRVEVPAGDRFIPELVRALTVPIESISVRRPTLDDVFLKLTGRAIRDSEISERDAFRESARRWTSRRR